MAALLLILSGCGSMGASLPTAASIDMAQTAIVLTQNAPPPAFQNEVAYPTLDAKLVNLPSWHSVITLSFDGVDSTLKEKSVARLEAQIFRNELGSARRVLFSAEGAAFGVPEARAIEAVRLGNDYYWVVPAQGVCATVADPARKRIADLTASTFVSGINRALPTGGHGQINGQDAWEYSFAPGDVALSLVQTDKVGNYTIAAGSLWIAPASNAIVRLTLTINVEDARLLDAEIPVTGQLRIVYDLKEVGAQYNISVPFGC